jgi:hypothetical protein
MMVNSHFQTSRSRSHRFALALAAIAHLLAIVIAPIADAATDRSMAPHVEEAGTSKHHSHADTTCIVCAAHTMVASASPEAFRLTVSSMRVTPPAQLSIDLPVRAAGAPVGTRAPPTVA